VDWSSLAPERRKALRSVIVAQCFGMLTQQMLAGGLLLLYLNTLGVAPSGILVVLNLAPFLSSLLSVPLGWASDRVGIKRFGAIGNFGMFTGLSIVSLAASVGHFAPGFLMPCVFTGLVIHTVGAAFFNSGWFSPLSHIVPRELAGRYFGLLRSTWQLVALGFFALSALLFSPRTPTWAYQIALGLGALALLFREYFYRSLPDAPPSREPAKNLFASVKLSFQLPGFLPYLGYLLLLILVTGNGQDMLRLSAVRGCGLGDNRVLFLTVSSMTGSLLGFTIAGKWIDRLGPRPVFLACHFGFSLALSLFPLRDLLHLDPFVAGILASLLLGLSSSSLGLATTAQSFRVCTGTQRTIAYAQISAVQGVGSGLSGFALAGVVHHLGSAQLVRNPFDLILIGLSAFILLQIAGLRLVRRGSQEETPHESRNLPVGGTALAANK